MGWSTDLIGHEGFVVGWRVHNGILRSCYGLDAPQEGVTLAAFQVACDCGWASRYYEAPPTARWWPNTTDLQDQAHEDAARRVWEDHLKQERKSTPMPLYPYRGQR